MCGQLKEELWMNRTSNVWMCKLEFRITSTNSRVTKHIIENARSRSLSSIRSFVCSLCTLVIIIMIMIVIIILCWHRVWGSLSKYAHTDWLTCMYEYFGWFVCCFAWYQCFAFYTLTHPIPCVCKCGSVWISSSCVHLYRNDENRHKATRYTNLSKIENPMID